MNKISFNIAEIITCTEIEGPHKRLAIWFQGCNLNCFGCFNPEIKLFKKANIITLEDLLKIIEKSKNENNIEGITLIGGEPTLQKHLSVLCEEVQKLELGIMMFTGKLYETLPETLTKHIDLIIDGPFIMSKLDTKRKIIGSTNQRIINVSNRYLKDISWFNNNDEYHYEINIKEKIVINGEAI